MSAKQRCPHCRTNAGVTRTRRGDLRCKLCAGPRLVLTDENLALSGNEVPLLVDARKGGRSSWLWAGVGLLFTMMGAVSLLIVSGSLLLLEPTSLVSGLLLLFASLPLLGAYWAWRRSRAERRSADVALEKARLSAAHDVLRLSQRELTAEELAGCLDLPLPMTESLLAQLNVDDSVTSHVTDEGEVTYRIAALRARVEEPSELTSETDEMQLARPPASSEEDEQDGYRRRDESALK